MTAESVIWTPLCMEPDELARWQEMQVRSRDLTARPCADCLAGFAAEMRAVGRCNGTPAGVEEDPMEPTPLAARRLPLDVTAPRCETCLHAPVCALRAALGALRSIPADVPALPDGLTVTISATVICAHWRRVTSPEARAAMSAGGHASAAKARAGRAAKRASAAAG